MYLLGLTFIKLGVLREPCGSEPGTGFFGFDLCRRERIKQESFYRYLIHFSNKQNKFTHRAMPNRRAAVALPHSSMSLKVNPVFNCCFSGTRTTKSVSYKLSIQAGRAWFQLTTVYLRKYLFVLFSSQKF